MPSPRTFCLFLLPLMCLSISQRKAPSLQCDQNLMQAYKLSGRKRPIMQSIGICKNVVDNCCTLLDQLSIVKLWQNYSKAHINNHIKSIVGMYENILSLHYAFANLNLSTAPMHFLRDAWVPYSKETCSKIFFDSEDDDLDFETPSGKDVIHGLDDSALLLEKQKSKPPVKAKRRPTMSSTNKRGRGLNKTPVLSGFEGLNGPDTDLNVLDRLNEASASYSEQFKRILIGVEPSQSPKEIRKHSKKISKSHRPTERKLSDSKESDSSSEESTKIEINKTQLRALKQISSIKSGFKESVEKAVSRFRKLVKNRSEKIASIRAKLERELSEIDLIINNAERDPESLKRYAENLHKKIPKTDKLNLQLFDELYKGKRQVEEAKDYIVKRRAIVENYLVAIKKEGEDLLEQEKQALLYEPSMPLKKDFITKFITDVETKRLPALKGSLPFYPSRKRDSPRFTPLIHPIHMCTIQRRTMYKKLHIFNEIKFRYCDVISLKLSKFNINDFAAYLPRVKETMVRLTSIKRTFYCMLCDQKQQRLIDRDNQVIHMDRQFCGSFIREFREFLMWKDVLLLRYMNWMFQYMECFETPGDTTIFKLHTMIEKEYRKSFFVKRCLQSIDTAQEFQFCHFLCSSYRVDGFTSYIEGDLALLKDIYSRLVSFMRKQHIALPRDFKATISEGKGINIDLPKFHHDLGTHEDIESEIQRDEMLKIAKENQRSKFGRILSVDEFKPDRLVSDKKGRKLIEVSDLIPEPLYSPVSPGPELQNFKLIFGSNPGYNPLKLDSLTDFNILTPDYIEDYQKKTKSEAINKSVIKVMLFPKKEIEIFNDDIKLKFNDKNGEDEEMDPAKLKDLLLTKLADQLNGVEEKKKELKKEEEKKKIEEGSMTLNSKEGLPELDFIFGN